MLKSLNEKKYKMRAMVRSRTKVYFQGDVYSVTSYNDKSIFSVLPKHANFISLIQNKIVVRPVDGKEMEVVMERGVIRVYENIIEVYLEG